MENNTVITSNNDALCVRVRRTQMKGRKPIFACIIHEEIDVKTVKWKKLSHQRQYQNTKTT